MNHNCPGLLRALVAASIFLVLPSCTSTKPSHEGPAAVTDSSGDVTKEVSISDFVVGAGDEIQLTVYRQNDLSAKFQIPPDGIIYLPLIGEIKAKGVSLRQIRNQITQGYAKYLVNPQVTLAVTTIKSNKVVVLGEVKQPGMFALETEMTALQAISAANGFTVDAHMGSVLLIRGDPAKPQLMILNLDTTADIANIGHNVALEKNDVIYVPASHIANAERFFVRLSNILRPFLFLEQMIILGPSVRDAFTGGAGGQRIIPLP